MSLHDDLLEQVEQLAKIDARRPKQESLPWRDAAG